MERFEELIARYLDNALSPAETRELTERLRADPKVARTFLTFYRQDRLLTELHRPETREAAEAIMQDIAHAEHAFVGTVMQTVRTESRREVPPPFARIREWLLWLRRPGVAFAGCALVLAGLAFLFFGATSGEPVLSLGSTAQATLERGGRIIPLTDGVKLQANDLITVTGTNGAALITYGRENTRIVISLDTRLKILSWQKGKRFELHQGKLEAVVVRQRLWKPMVLATAQAEARVLGTKFTLVATTNATRLEVAEGKVRLTRLGDDESVDVSAGKYAVAASGSELAVQPVTGRILREYWTNLPGEYYITILTSHPDFPDRPSGREYLDKFEAPSHSGENYGARIRGYLHPPVTGDYTFWIAAEGNGEFFLSPNESPDKRQHIGYIKGWSPREWTKDPGQQSASITLVAGRKYYIEALHKQGTNDDHLAVAWQGPNREREVIPGEFLSPFTPKPKEKKR